MGMRHAREADDARQPANLPKRILCSFLSHAHGRGEKERLRQGGGRKKRWRKEVKKVEKQVFWGEEGGRLLANSDNPPKLSNIFFKQHL